ncbi:DNA-directed RNA polymerase I subunit rpa49 [Blastocladiella emersonii ATCC 22665]|nr:DNA-directed RNA polymerase I subunit rpa49 [Blastocladiella emersonii ATCC 22665]
MKRKIIELEVDAASDAAGVSGPLLATLGGVTPASTTPFSVYRSTAPAKTARAAHRVVASETHTVQLYGDSFSEPTGTEGAAQYMVGLVNRKTGRVRLVPSPVVHVEPKYKTVVATAAERVDKSRIVAARNALGEAFGNKKAKTAIRAIEKNRINADALDVAAGELQANVTESLEFIPTAEELAADAELDNPLPPYDITTDDVAEIYPVASLFPGALRRLLDEWCKAVFAAKNQAQVDEMLAELGIGAPEGETAAGARQTYAERELKTLVVKKKANGKRDTLRASLSLLAVLLTRMAQVSDRDLKSLSALASSLRAPANMALELQRAFADKVAVSGTRVKYAMTPRAKTRVQCFALAALLHLQSFQLSTADVAKDFATAPKNIALLACSMGCKATSLSAAQLAQMGTADLASRSSRVTLEAPLKFPPPPRGAKN